MITLDTAIASLIACRDLLASISAAYELEKQDHKAIDDTLEKVRSIIDGYAADVKATSDALAKSKLPPVPFQTVSLYDLAVQNRDPLDKAEPFPKDYLAACGMAGCSKYASPADARSIVNRTKSPTFCSDDHALSYHLSFNLDDIVPLKDKKLMAMYQ